MIEDIIRNYTDAYNRFDSEAMIKDMHQDIEFEHFENGRVTFLLRGREAFLKQAEATVGYFQERSQVITRMEVKAERVEAWIDYTAVPSVDLPNGVKAGSRMELKGRSLLTFRGGKIIKLQDFS